VPWHAQNGRAPGAPPVERRAGPRPSGGAEEARHPGAGADGAAERSSGPPEMADPDALDGGMGDDGGRHATSHRTPIGVTIPPREHTERERLALRPEIRGELGQLIEALREVFQRDRAVASQSVSARCGVCYLYYPLADLDYREADGFYVCSECRQALRGKRLPMIRRQQR